MKHCAIFAAGDLFTKPSIPEDSLVICADAGYNHAAKYGIKVDILVGDFDSLPNIPNNTQIIKYPAEKDYTDTELAVKIALKEGCSSFTIYGSLGGERFEHTLANLQLAAGIAKCGYIITLTDCITIIEALHNGTKFFNENEKGYVSVFSGVGDAKGVSIKNLKYELCNVTLPCTGTLGVSNEFIGKKSSIEVKDGTLLIIYRRKDGKDCNEA